MSRLEETLTQDFTEVTCPSSDEAALSYTVSDELLLAIPLLGHVNTHRAVASRLVGWIESITLHLGAPSKAKVLPKLYKGIMQALSSQLAMRMECHQPAAGITLR